MEDLLNIVNAVLDHFRYVYDTMAKGKMVGQLDLGICLYCLYRVFNFSAKRTQYIGNDAETRKKMKDAPNYVQGFTFFGIFFFGVFLSDNSFENFHTSPSVILIITIATALMALYAGHRMRDMFVRYVDGMNKEIINREVS
ncbi:MAG: hypothetical protein NT120_00500 [Candidatus Aenigmarchaeota archaeon]|nr:hypothetical protein [Candidatus Aenigmarchaeota archaeon]